MSTAAAIIAGLGAVEAAAPLIQKIIELADKGLSDEEIQRRIGDPNGVGKDLIGRITARRKRGHDLLGRDPKPPG